MIVPQLYVAVLFVKVRFAVCTGVVFRCEPVCEIQKSPQFYGTMKILFLGWYATIDSAPLVLSAQRNLSITDLLFRYHGMRKTDHPFNR